MMALLLTRVKAYNLAHVTSVQMLSRRSAELTIEGKPLLVISQADMTIRGFALALARAVDTGGVVDEDELAQWAVEAS